MKQDGWIDLQRKCNRKSRYSPLLAYMMVPNMWSPSIGKLVFVMFDILAGHLIYCILRCSFYDDS